MWTVDCGLWDLMQILRPSSSLARLLEGSVFFASEPLKASRKQTSTTDLQDLRHYFHFSENMRVSFFVRSY